MVSFELKWKKSRKTKGSYRLGKQGKSAKKIMMAFANFSTCYFFMAIASLVIFMFSMFVLSTRRIGKAGVLYVVKRCVYFTLRVGKNETPCYKYIFFLRS
jgi:hypothetical protein